MTTHLFSLRTTNIAKELNESLNKIKNWTFQSKMNFKQDPVNKLNKFYSVVKYLKYYILASFFTMQKFHKQISKLTFCKYLAIAFTEAIEVLGFYASLYLRHYNDDMIRQWWFLLSFCPIRLGYDDVLGDQTFNSAFHDKLESIQ